MQYKIYGDSYRLREAPGGKIDSYAVKNKLVDIPPNGKCLGYVTMEDGSVIECYKAKPIALILCLIVAILASCGGVASYFLFFQPKDVVLTPGVGDDVTPIVVKQGEDNNVVKYNGFTSVSEDSVNLNFQNGDYPCSITISGEGIESETIQLQPGEFVDKVKVTYTTTEGLVPATLTIQTGTSTSTQAIVIEVPDNTTPNSPDGVLDDYWKGEFIYVPPTQSE